jgi:uncharacterized protein
MLIILLLVLLLIGFLPLFLWAGPTRRGLKRGVYSHSEYGGFGGGFGGSQSGFGGFGGGASGGGGVSRGF